jgi:hypothetical protein
MSILFKKNYHKPLEAKIQGFELFEKADLFYLKFPLPLTRYKDMSL